MHTMIESLFGKFDLTKKFTRFGSRGTSSLLVALLTTFFLVGQGLAQVSLADLERCREEPNDATRLQCYDSEVSRLSTADSASQTAEQRFGFRGDIARESLERDRAARPNLASLESRVLSVRTLPRGEWIVTLENGQQWAQVPMGIRFPIAVGDRVTITPLSLGSFVLTSDSNQSTRVRRRR